MKISIREAYETAQKSLPGYKVNVEVSLNGRYEDEPRIKWNISANPTDAEGESIYEDSEIFAIALARAVATAQNAKVKPVEDVTVEQETRGNSTGDELLQDEPDEAERKY